MHTFENKKIHQNRQKLHQFRKMGLSNYFDQLHLKIITQNFAKITFSIFQNLPRIINKSWQYRVSDFMAKSTAWFRFFRSDA